VEPESGDGLDRPEPGLARVGRPSRVTRFSIFVVLVVDSLTNGLFIPLSLLYLTTRTGTSLARVGVLLTIAGLVALPLPLYSGRLVDRWGARPVVLAAQILQAVGFAGYVIFSGPVAIFVVATVASLGRGVFWSAIFTLLSGLADGDPDPRARERWFGVTGALRAAGYGLGAVLAGVALSVDSTAFYRWLITANAAALAVAAVLVVIGAPRTRAPAGAEAAEGRGYRTLLRDRPFLALISVNTVFALCNVLLSVGFPVYAARSLPGARWAVGPLLGLNTVVQALCLPLVVRLARRFRRDVSLCLAALFWAAWGLATLGARHVPAALAVPFCVLAILCYATAQMLHSPTSNAIAADSAPIDLRGRYLASFQYSFAIATVIAPTLFATLLGVGADLPWIFVCLAALATVPALLILGPRLPAGALTGVPAGGLPVGGG
jgi:MFS family permease